MKEINFKNVEEQDVRELASHSEMAKKFLEEADTIELFALADYDGISADVPFNEDAFSFHPNGQCGTVLVPDEYMFSIRCNHLMWADGACESFECIGAVMIYGNHKGSLIIYLLVGFKD